MTIIQKISNWYFTQKALPYWCILVIDCAIVAFSIYLGQFFTLGGIGLAESFWEITWGILIGICFYVLYFKLFHTYSGIVRYSSFVDLQKVAIASLLASVTFYVLGLIVIIIWPRQHSFVFPNTYAVVFMFTVSSLLLWL